MGPITKQWKNKKVGACFLTCSTLKVGRCVKALGWDQVELKSESSKWNQPTQPKKEGV